MKVKVENQVMTNEEWVDGVEFDIKGESTWIQIGYSYVKVDKEDLIKILGVTK